MGSKRTLCSRCNRTDFYSGNFALQGFDLSVQCSPDSRTAVSEHIDLYNFADLHIASILNDTN